MKLITTLLVTVVLTVPALAGAAVETIPGASSWYFHADLDEMRNSDAGKHLYSWLDREVFADVRKDAGIDLGNEADRPHFVRCAATRSHCRLPRILSVNQP